MLQHPDHSYFVCERDSLQFLHTLFSPILHHCVQFMDKLRNKTIYATPSLYGNTPSTLPSPLWNKLNPSLLGELEIFDFCCATWWWSKSRNYSQAHMHENGGSSWSMQLLHPRSVSHGETSLPHWSGWKETRGRSCSSFFIFSVQWIGFIKTLCIHCL